MTYFTKGAGIDTLTTEIYAELKIGVHPEMYALSTLFFAAVIVFVALLLVKRGHFARGGVHGRLGVEASLDVAHRRQVPIELLAFGGRQA